MIPDFNNWRFNPFTEVYNDIAIVGELHTIAYDEDANAYGIRLHEGIRLIGSLPFNSHIDYSIVEDVTGGATFTEIPRTSNPSAGQFRVDYHANTYYSTSFIEFNASDDGTNVIVNYRGTGTIVKDRYQLNQAVVIPTALGVEGFVEITDYLDMTNGLINNVAQPVSLNDAVAFLNCVVRYNTHIGYGSTNTKIPRFSTQVVNTASGQITIDNSITLGFSVTVNAAGLYAFSYSTGTMNNGIIGLSLNSAQLINSIDTITAANRLAITGIADESNLHVSWLGFLAIGDVVRPHTNGVSTVDDVTSFTVVKIT